MVVRPARGDLFVYRSALCGRAARSVFFVANRKIFASGGCVAAPALSGDRQGSGRRPPGSLERTWPPRKSFLLAARDNFAEKSAPADEAVPLA